MDICVLAKQRDRIAVFSFWKFFGIMSDIFFVKEDYTMGQKEFRTDFALKNEKHNSKKSKEALSALLKETRKKPEERNGTNSNRSQSDT